MVAPPLPLIYLPSSEKVKSPESIVKLALVSLPPPSFNSILLLLLVTLIGLFAAFNPE